MASSPPSLLTPLQRELLEGFFERDLGFFLTGGAALAGFLLGHRTTKDLDLFSPVGGDLELAARQLTQAARTCGASVESIQQFPEFRRYLVRRGEESCLVDLVIDRAPMLDAVKVVSGRVRVDTVREITANKLCTLLGRTEPRDLVDLRLLLPGDAALEAALADASKKDAGMEAITLAWLLDQFPFTRDDAGAFGVSYEDLDAFRRRLGERLRAIAFAQTSAKRPGS